jgi:hypothetical protein
VDRERANVAGFMSVLCLVAAVQPSTDSIQFMKNVKYPPDDELEKTSREAFMEMMEYQVSGEASTYMGWQIKRESKSMYMHAFSDKSFVGEDMARVFNETWTMFYDEAKQELLHRRRSKFCVRGRSVHVRSSSCGLTSVFLLVHCPTSRSSRSSTKTCT